MVINRLDEILPVRKKIFSTSKEKILLNIIKHIIAREIHSWLSVAILKRKKLNN